MIQAEALVIGGGLLGCAVAYYLAGEGVNVVVVDKQQLNRGASGQNAGSLHFQLEYRMIEGGEGAARKAAEAMPLHLKAQKIWGELSSELGAELGVVQHGGLMVAETSDQVGRLSRKVSIEQEAGLHVELLDRERVHSLAPYLGDGIVAAALCPGEGKADPRKCTLAFAAAAARRGARVHTELEVRSLQRNGRCWRAEFLDGRICEAETIVIAAGAWSAKVAALMGAELPVKAIALTMSVTARTPKVIDHLLQHAGRRLSMKQSVEGNVLIGGGWPAAFKHIDGEVDLDRRPDILLGSLTGNAAAAAAVVPMTASLPVLRVWSGVTALADDQLPVIGEIAGCPGAFVAAGGSGFTLGPVYARMLADMILAKPQQLDARPYSPARFLVGQHA